MISGSNLWLVNSPGNILFRTKDPSDIVIANFWHVGRLKFLARNMSHMHHTPFSAKHLDSTMEPPTSVTGSLGYVVPEVLNQRLLVNGWGYLPLLTIHDMA